MASFNIMLRLLPNKNNYHWKVLFLHICTKLIECATSKYYPIFLKFGIHIFHITETRGIRKVYKHYKYHLLPYKMKYPNVHVIVYKIMISSVSIDYNIVYINRDLFYNRQVLHSKFISNSPWPLWHYTVSNFT